VARAESRPDTAEASAGRTDGRSPNRRSARRGNPVPEATVTAMFDEIAPVYDRLNTIMTFGFDGRWRRAAVDATRLGAGGSVIDVASGTGKLALELADHVGPFGRVLAVDLSPGMIRRAAATHRDVVQLEFRVGNALSLPAGDAEFDAATIGFGVRNLADFEAGFRELRRVVRPGGRVVCLELTMPRPRWWGRVFQMSFRRLAPLGGRVFGGRSAYHYLPASLEGFPNPEQLALTMRRAGLVDVSYRRLGLGSVALHTGLVPGVREVTSNP
jgi:demethylmenaquinone methyltransferase / 2-methoxy-6-polyprenyl-1,4-benzoquinol methylase